MFERGPQGGAAWVQTQDLDDQVYAFFHDDPPHPHPMGGAVAVSGDFVVFSMNSQAMVCQFTGGAWSPTSLLNPKNPGGTYDVPVSAVSLTQTATGTTYFALGTPLSDFLGPQDAGEVLLFQAVASPGLAPIEFVTSVNAPGRMANDRFGTSVAFGGNTLLVGSPGHDHFDVPDAGSVYVFVQGHAPGCPPIPQPGGWGLLARRTSEAPAGNTGFGDAVAVDGTTFVMGEPGAANDDGALGSVRVFDGMQPMVAGLYDLLVQVDPFDAIPELGDTDPAANTKVASTKISVCVPALNQPDLSVESVQLVPVDDNTGDGYLVTDQYGKQLVPAGINVRVRMAGAFDGPLANVRLRTWFTVGADPTQHAGKVFNTATGQFEADAVLPTMSSGDEVDASFDVDYSGNVPLSAGDHHITVHAAVEMPPGVMDVKPDNDSLGLPDQDDTVVAFNECSWVQSYGKQMGNSDFNIHVNCMGSLALSSSLDQLPGNDLFSGAKAEYGSIGALSAGTGLTLFGHDLGDIVEFKNLLERDPVYEYDQTQYPGIGPGYGFVGSDIEFVNPLTGELDVVLSFGPIDSIDLLSIPPGELPDQIELLNGGFKVTVDSFAKEKSFEKEKIFFPGGIPVTVKGTASGKIGIDFAFQATDSLVLTVAPNVDLSAKVDFQLGSCDVLCVGAQGTIILINDTFSVFGGLGMTVTKGTDPTGADAESIGALACFKVENQISMLSGKLSVYAVYPWVVWCVEDVLGLEVPYPCDLIFLKAEQTLIEWNGLVNLVQKLVDISLDTGCCVPVKGLLNCATDVSQVCPSVDDT